MRILDRAAAVLLAALVAAVGVVAVIEIVYAAVGDGTYFVVDWPAAVDALDRNSWSETGPKIFGGVTVALGVALCAVGLRHGRSGRLPVRALDPSLGSPRTTSTSNTTTRTTRTTDTTRTVTFVRRRNLARALRRAAESVDGVTSARVRFGRRRVKILVSLRPRTSGGAPEQVAEVVGRTLASFDLVSTPPVTVRASSRAGRGRTRRQGDDGLVVEPGSGGRAAGTGTGPHTGTGTDAGTGTEPYPNTTVLTRPAGQPGFERQGEPTRRDRRQRPFAPRVERLDRVLLTLWGLVLVGSGGVVLLAGFGVLGTETENAPVLTDEYRSFAADHGWFWPVVGVAAGVLTVAALAWLIAQFSTGRLRGLAVTDDEIGSAYVEGPGLARAVADDADRDDGVSHARATLLGTPSDPLVRLVLIMEPDADVASTRRFTEWAVLGRARHALDRPDLRGQVELEPTAEPARRAR